MPFFRGYFPDFKFKVYIINNCNYYILSFLCYLFILRCMKRVSASWLLKLKKINRLNIWARPRKIRELKTPKYIIRKETNTTRYAQPSKNGNTFLSSCLSYSLKKVQTFWLQRHQWNTRYARLLLTNAVLLGGKFWLYFCLGVSGLQNFS